ncbi:MAG: hypothetical protein J1D77_02275 [Muribaculaceae bacterium]|nr:hypothetical protein [Muribaculaceae bacterium]
MNQLTRHKSFFSRLPFLAAGIVLMISGCRSEDTPETPEEEQILTQSPRISLNISPLTLGVASEDVTEMIKSLRIIILNEVELDDGTTECYVEYNQYFNFQGNPQSGDMFGGGGEMASTFRWIITRNTVPGLKKFYLVANETMVEDIKFQTDMQLPDGIEEGMTLHDFLNYYGADYIANLDYPLLAPEEDDPKGAEFEALVNTLYYTPTYLQTSQQLSGGGERNVIFLPYTSYYEVEMASGEDIATGKSTAGINFLDGMMYLVPAATKIRFTFQNYRPDPVKILSFKLGGMASDMFLFAQVGGKDLYKDFGALKKIWWIDWLSKVSEASYGFPKPDENLAFSTSYGWMNDYTVPSDAFAYDPEGEVMDNGKRYGVIELVEDSNEPWEVPENSSGNAVQGDPGELPTGYFYLPESRYMVEFPMFDDQGEFTENQELQAYYLKLYMVSGDNGQLAAVKDTQIGNLSSMFRNTNTFITIKLRDALDVGAYAQIEDWVEGHTTGTVLEDTLLDE